LLLSTQKPEALESCADRPKITPSRDRYTRRGEGYRRMRLLYRERRLGGHSVSSVQLRPTPNPGGDPAVSVGRLFEEYSDRIYGYCLRRLGSSADAEDAVQMTFLCAHRAVQRGIVPESESAWLFAIAKNVCRWQQRTMFRRNRLLSDAELDAIASPSRADDEDLLVGLKDALASIPETQQRALVLREWRGLSSREVAGQLGMSQPATYALLTRARRSLAHALTALPQQAALGLVALVYEVRSHIKALFGGSVAVKTVAATTVVAAVAVGGVTAGKAIVGVRSVPQAPQPALVEDRGSSQNVDLRSGSGGVADAVSGTASIRGQSNTSAVRTSGESDVTAGEPSTPSSPSGEEVVPPSHQDGSAGETRSDLTGLPVRVPEPPPLTVPPLPPLPTDLLPPLPPLPTVPPLPPLPTDLLPPAPEPPPLPPVDLAPPPVDLPPPTVDLPPPPDPLPDPLPDLLP
jgi:RNA polymerase sigma factor (sigma-70 family)